jgi:hypothetical protein
MDEIFRSNTGAFVFTSQDLVGRKRPQKFIDAEVLRTQAADGQVLNGKGNEIVHVEAHEGV